jgi:uncharacterized small protein (DUF1192 family)
MRADKCLFQLAPKGLARAEGDRAMSRDEDEFFAAKKPVTSQDVVEHVLGEPLDRLSVDELAARIALLQAEITRLEAARLKKDASREAAAAFFKT